MKKVPRFDKKQEKILKRLLQNPEGTPESMSYLEAAGVLFAVVCCPERILPSEWIPFILSPDDAEFKSMEEVQDISTALLSLYNYINWQVQNGIPELPPGCVVQDEPLDNLHPDALLAQWARGFAYGQDWLEDVWDNYLPEEFDYEIGSCMVILSFFSNQEFAEICLQEVKEDGHSLEHMAIEVLSLLPDAMRSYAAIGITIGDSLREADGHSEKHRNAGLKVGRNDPCPCDSGIKYKKCCLDSGNGQNKIGAAEGKFGSSGITDSGMDSSIMQEPLTGYKRSADAAFDEAVRTAFSGLSIDQMESLLMDPFGLDSPAKFNTDIIIPEEITLLRLLILIVRELGDGPLKVTGTGNLPQKTVRGIALNYFGSEGFILEKHFYAGFRSEKDFMNLHITRVIAEMSGFIKKRHQRFSLTRRGESLLSDGVTGDVFMRLFTTICSKYNWGYWDGYPDLPIVQASGLFALFLLQKYGEKARPLKFYGEKFLQAFPQLLEEKDVSSYFSREDLIKGCFKTRALNRFAHFLGFMEYTKMTSRRLAWDDDMVKKTAFLDDFLNFRLA